MIITLRIASFLAGLALVGSVPFFIFAFAASVGDLDNQPISAFLEPLWYTVPMGAANLLIGLPALVSGARKPNFRVLAGISLAVSFAITAFASVVYFPFLFFLAFQAVLFAVFVWPARHFTFANTSLQGAAYRRD
ncbi:MAG: hypothetical protein FD164_2205 [Nitrospirae bacterium]|nr:MAG: hypothetical protein FD164_2205 [Nitrospirota bacterium]